MELVFGCVIFPAVFVLLATGTGLLIERGSGGLFPATLVPVVGTAGLIVLGQVTTSFASTAPLTGAAFVAVASVGLLSRRLRLVSLLSRARERPWPLLAAAVAYLIAIAPVLFAGRPTLTFYLTDTTTGTHLAGADWLIHHGRHFAQLPLDSSYGLQIEAYFKINNYPAGGHVLLGGLGQLSPVRLTWLYQPYMAMVLALVALPAYTIMRRSTRTSALAGVVAVFVSVPALVYALDLTGSIKELTVLSFVLSLGVCASTSDNWLRHPRSGITVGVLVGAGIATLGVPFAAWGVVALAGPSMLLVRRSKLTGEWRENAKRAVGTFVVFVATTLISAPAVTTQLQRSTNAAQGIADTTDPGNLLQPLKSVQALGVWITGQYRFDPGEHLPLTYALIGVSAIAALLGLLALARDARWPLLLWVALSLVLWRYLTTKGTVWTDGKMILISSPVVLCLVGLGIADNWSKSRRAVGLLLGLSVAFGIVYSDAQQYHQTNLAPTGRFDELAAINSRFAGRGPALATDFDEFVFYELRDLRVSSPGFAYRTREVASSGIGYGQSADIDSLPQSSLRHVNLIVQRRGPATSRPPSNYGLVRRGEFYDVWERRVARKVIARLASSGPFSAQSVQPCSLIKRLGAQAQRQNGRLEVAQRRPVTVLGLERLTHSPGFADGASLALNGSGRIEARVRTRESGIYDLFIKGQIGRKLRVYVDGQSFGAVGEQTAGLNNFLSPVRLRLSAGVHDLLLIKPGGSLRPGDDAPSTLDGLVISPTANDSVVRQLNPADAERLCGQLSDWVEAVS